MKSYIIKKYNKHFYFTNEINNKGSRPKKTVIDKKGRKAIFKYQNYNCSEACSEKLSYEIAKILKYECAQIELATDENGTLGVLNYLFIDKNQEEHTDAVAYIKKNNEEIKQFHTLKNIKNSLDELDKNLFYDFLKIMVFDALVGETDRHEENWGVINKNGKYRLSPLYDNGCNLLREFYNEEYGKKFYDGTKNFDASINRSETLIFKEDVKRFKHFELIKELYKLYPKEIKKEIENLNNLNNKTIENIVNQIPKDLMSKEQREYIIKYVEKRRDILFSIIEEGSVV